MATSRYGLLTPPREEEERSPYRPVWRSLIGENAAMFGVLAGLFVAQVFLGIPIPSALQQPANVLIAILPTWLWVTFSVLPERLVPEPRQRLIVVGFMSTLAARSIGEPIITEFLRVQEWLPLAPAINRIIGYTFTVGIVECGLCYVVIRLLTWPDHLRTRYDTVAYAAAAAVGYTFLGNLEFALTGNPVAHVVALHTFAAVSSLTVVLLIVAYGMAGTFFDGAGSIFQPILFAIAAFVTGLVIPVRGGFLNASFGIGGTSLPRYLFGIAFSAGLFGVGVLVVQFLYRFAERQEAERELGDRG